MMQGVKDSYPSQFVNLLTALGWFKSRSAFSYKLGDFSDDGCLSFALSCLELYMQISHRVSVCIE